ncbi:MAG: AraC family transcriptional regulator [Acutalibacteraceae bacterium]|nr:AraC family transcriptional regulator [Acutalibacteraceae bacterium]
MTIADFNVVFCTYFENKKEFIYNYETYKEYVLFCVESGSFSYGYSPDEADRYVAKSGDIVICCPDRTFYRKTITPVNFCMIKFVPDVALARYDTPVFLSDTARFFKNISMLKSSFLCDIKKADHMTNHYCRDIVYQLFSAIQQKSAPIAEAMDYINANYTADISISHLAHTIGYSTAHFINLFKEHYGYTPKAYISFLRLKKAQHLLKSSNLTVGEISVECGFSDILYFCRFFKSQCGMTPTEFKKAVMI